MDGYITLEELGKGSYGTVYKCQHRETGSIVAIKQMKDENANEHLRKTAIREAKILRQLQHPNVVRLLELFRSKTSLYMVFEFMNRSILNVLEKNPRGLSTIEVRKILWQLVLGLNFLHSQQIIHRDLKPENILTDDQGAVKLADFGFARPQTQGGQNLSPYVATRWYRAPELLVGDTYGPGVDIWALGCLLVELSTGVPLFPGKSNMDQLWLILKTVGCTPRQQSRMRGSKAFAGMKMPTDEEMIPLEKRFAHFDSASLDLLKACLDPEPKNRPTAVQLLTHNYFMVAKAVLDPYTMAAVKAQAAAKELAARSQHAAADSQLQERPSPAKPSRETAFAAATAAAAAAAASRGGSNPQLPMSQLGAPARKSGGGAAGAHQGGGPDEDPENIGRGETNSDGGAQGLDDPDNEYETEVPIDELLSPEKRAKIQAWVDALPDVKPHGRQATVAAAAASAAGSAAHSPILSPHRGMDGLGTHPMDAYGAGQSAPNSGVQLQSHLGLLSGHGALSPTAQIAGPSATPATPTHAAASALKAALGHHAADTSPQQHSGPLATLRARGGTDGGSIADRHSPGGIGGYARGPGDAIVGDRPSPIRGGLAMHRPQSALNALLQNAGPLACDPPSVLSVQSGTIPYGSVTHGSPGMQPVRRSTSNMTSVLDSMNVENLVMNNLQLATSPGTPQTPGTHGTGELAAANPAWLAPVLSPGSGAAQGVNPSPQSQGTRPAVGASPGRTPTKQSSSSRLGVLGILESGAPRKALSQNGVTVTADTPSQPQPVAAQPSLPQPQPPAARAPLGMGHESPGGRRRTISNNGSTAQASTPVTAMTKLLENTKSESLVISPTQHAPSPLQLLMQQHRASMDGGSGQVPVPVATSPGSAMDALARLAGRRTNDGMATVQPPAAPASTGFLEAVAKLATPGPSAAPLATVTSSGLVTASGAAARPAAPGALTAQPQATTPTEQAKEPSYLEKIKQLAAGGSAEGSTAKDPMRVLQALASRNRNA